MSSSEYPPKTKSVEDPIKEAERLAIEEIARKLANGETLSVSDQAYYGRRSIQRRADSLALDFKKSTEKLASESKSEGLKSVSEEPSSIPSKPEYLGDPVYLHLTKKNEGSDPALEKRELPKPPISPEDQAENDEVTKPILTDLEKSLKNKDAVTQMKIWKTYDDLSKKLGVPLEKRPTIEIPAGTMKQVWPDEMEARAEEARKIEDAPLNLSEEEREKAKRRRGLLARDINYATEVRVDPEMGLIAKYRTISRDSNEKVVELTGKPTEKEAAKKSIIQTKQEGLPLTPEQRDLLKERPVQLKFAQTMERLDRQNEVSAEKDLKDSRQIANDLMNARELTKEQEFIYNNNREVKEAVEGMLRTGKLIDDERRFEKRGLPKITEKIETAYQDAGTFLPPDAILTKRIPRYSSLSPEAQKIALDNLKREIGKKSMIPEDSVLKGQIKGFDKMSDPQKKEALANRRQEIKKERQFEEDDLIGVTGYLKGKEMVRNSMPEHMKPVLDKIDNSKEEKLAIAQKTHAEEIFKRMNLNKEKLLEAVPNFFYLTDSQQIYVMEKLRQKVHGDMSLKAELNVENNIKRKTKFLSGDYFKKRFQMWTKEAGQARERKRLVEDVKKGEMMSYKDDLKILVEHVKDLPFPISYDAEGKLYIEYEKVEGEGNIPGFAHKFNQVATELSEIPYEWSQSNASKSQKKKYEQVKNQFDYLKNVLMQAKREEFRKNDTETADANALYWGANIDGAVQMNQLLTSHPELNNLEDQKIFAKADNFNQEFIRNKISALTGAGARWLAKKNLAFSGGLAGVAAIAGYMGWRKEANKYNAKERRKRYGEAIEDKGIKKYMHAGQAYEKLEFLVDRINNSVDEAEMNKLSKLLRNRLFVVDERLKAGRINFGDGKEQLDNKFKLFKIIAEAKHKILLSGGYDDINQDQDTEILLKRFNQIQQDKKAEFRKYLRQGGMAAFAAATSGLAFVVGYEIADNADRVGSGQTFFERLKEQVHDGGDGKWDDVPSQPLPSVPKHVIESVPPTGMHHSISEGIQSEAAHHQPIIDSIPKAPIKDSIISPHEAIVDSSHTTADSSIRNIHDSSTPKPTSTPNRVIKLPVKPENPAPINETPVKVPTSRVIEHPASTNAKAIEHSETPRAPEAPPVAGSQSKIFELKGDTLHGKIIFERDKDGNVIGMGMKDFGYKDAAYWQNSLKENWKEGLGRTREALVRSDIPALKTYEAIRDKGVADGIFTRDSGEYKYLTKIISNILKRETNVLKLTPVEEQILKEAA